MVQGSSLKWNQSARDSQDKTPQPQGALGSGLALGLGAAITALGREGDLESTAPHKTKKRIKKVDFFYLDLEVLVLLVAFEYLELVLLHDAVRCWLAPQLAGTGN